MRHPLALAVLGAIGLAGSWTVARQRPLPGWELRLTTWLNGAPDTLATALWPVMQVGAIGVGLAVGVVVLWLVRRDRLLLAAFVLTTLASWLLAKLVKVVVDRGRPIAYLPDIDVRDSRTTSFGYVSSHGAVAATVAVFVVVAVPARWRPLVVVLALVVGVARIVYGVHFPADVVGGWSLGLLVGLAGLAVLDRVRPHSSPAD